VLWKKSVNWPFLFDFGYFYVGSLCLQSGGDPYGLCLQERFNEFSAWGLGGDFLRLFPLGLWILYPLAWFSFPTAAALWLIMSSAALLRAFYLIKHDFPGKNRILTCLLFFPVIKCFYFGQNSTLYLWLLLEALNIRGRAPFSAALLLSIGLTKPNIFVPILAFILTSKIIPIRPLLIGLTTGLIVQLSLIAVILPTPLFQVFSPSASWFSQSQLLPQPTLSAVLNLDSARFVLFTANVLFQLYAGARRTDLINFFWAICIPLSLLCAPYLWSHDQALLLPAWVLALRSAKYPYLIAILVAVLGSQLVLLLNLEWTLVLLSLTLFVHRATINHSYLKNCTPSTVPGAKYPH